MTDPPRPGRRAAVTVAYQPPNDRSSSWQGRTTKTPLNEGPPYCWTHPGNYAHRIRSASIYTAPWGTWTSALMWCGQGRRLDEGFSGDQPPEGFEVCATCEGRAVAVGLSSGVIEVKEGATLMFRPYVRPKRCPGNAWQTPPIPTALDSVVQCCACGQLATTYYSGGPYNGSVKLKQHNLPEVIP